LKSTNKPYVAISLAKNLEPLGKDMDSALALMYFHIDYYDIKGQLVA